MQVSVNDRMRERRGHKDRVGRLVLWGSLVFAFASCTEREETRTPAASVRDSVGIRVIDFSVPAISDALVVSSAEMVEIAGCEDDPIGNARDLIFWGEDRIVLADNDFSLRVYNFAGERVEQFGGRGEGPGEFRDILLLSSSPSGELAVVDPLRLQLSVFDEQGAFQRSVSLFPGPDGLLIDPRAILGTSSVVMVSLPSARGVSERNPHGYWGFSSIYIYDEATGVWDSIASVPITQCGEGYVDRCVPGDSMFAGMVRTTGETVVVTPADWPEIQVYDPSGPLLDLIRIGEPPDGGFTLLVVGQDGVFWVGRVGGDTWMIADTRSMTLRRIAFPEEFRLRDIGNMKALGLSVDSLGVQKAVLIRLPDVLSDSTRPE